jgi:hypothetical protein
LVRETVVDGKGSRLSAVYSQIERGLGLAVRAVSLNNLCSDLAIGRKGGIDSCRERFKSNLIFNMNKRPN